MEIIAHRGASHDAPENTLAAARLAWTQGADALECDVQLTRDGRLVVFHDNDASRVSGKAVRIADLDAADATTLDVGAWKDPRFAGEHPPLLSELLGALPPAKRIFIELKNGPESVPELLRTLARSTLNPAQVAVISFHFESVRALKQALPRCEAYWIVERGGANPEQPDDLVRLCRESRLDGLDFDAGWPVDSGLVSRIHAAGLKLYVWTVDDPHLAKKLLNAGVDGLATNKPGWIRKQLAPDST